MKTLPRFIAVIHCTSNNHNNVIQVRTALDNGAGGVFLIDHDRTHGNLLVTYVAVRTAFPVAWIGLNFLDLDPVSAVRSMPNGCDGIWLDDPGVDPAETSRVARQLGEGERWRCFAGCDFKYQQTPANPPNAAAELAKLFSVVTTSGRATGMAASMDKVAAMKAAIPTSPLALASGVSVSNAADYLPYVDCFLVATGISKSFHELDPVKVTELADLLTSDRGDHTPHPEHTPRRQRAEFLQSVAVKVADPLEDIGLSVSEGLLVLALVMHAIGKTTNQGNLLESFGAAYATVLRCDPEFNPDPS